MNASDTRNKSDTKVCVACGMVAVNDEWNVTRLDFVTRMAS